MKFRFFRTGEEAWEKVKEKILKSIEEEEREKASIFIQGADSTLFADAGQVEEPGKNILVTVNASDSGLAGKEGAK